jgi:hypothetical protein
MVTTRLAPPRTPTGADSSEEPASSDQPASGSKVKNPGRHYIRENIRTAGVPSPYAEYKAQARSVSPAKTIWEPQAPVATAPFPRGAWKTSPPRRMESPPPAYTRLPDGAPFLGSPLLRKQKALLVESALLLGAPDASDIEQLAHLLPGRSRP